MLVTLGDLLKIAKDTQEEVDRLYSRRRTVSRVEYTAGEEPIQHDQTVNEVTLEIDTKLARIRHMRELIARYNLTETVDYRIRDTKITQAEALTLLGQLLREKREIDMFAQMAPRERMAMGSERVDYLEATFDPEYIKERSADLAQSIRKLRTAIDRVNINVEIEIPDSYVS